jgi:hypothetical protein
MPKAIPPVKAASDLDDEIEDKEISSSSSKQTIDKRENQVSFCNDKQIPTDNSGTSTKPSPN